MKIHIKRWLHHYKDILSKHMPINMTWKDIRADINWLMTSIIPCVHDIRYLGWSTNSIMPFWQHDENTGEDQHIKALAIWPQFNSWDFQMH